MTSRIKIHRKDLQNLWRTGRDVTTEMDRVSLSLVDSTENHIRARMVFKNILSEEYWVVETVLESPMFEAFNYGESDRDDCFTCRSVAPVEWAEISYEEIQTLAETPPKLPLKL